MLIKLCGPYLPVATYRPRTKMPVSGADTSQIRSGQPPPDSALWFSWPLVTFLSGAHLLGTLLPHFDICLSVVFYMEMTWTFQNVGLCIHRSWDKWKKSESRNNCIVSIMWVWRWFDLKPQNYQATIQKSLLHSVCVSLFLSFSSNNIFFPPHLIPPFFLLDIGNVLKN